MAVREDHIEMAEFLLKEGADVNCLDQDQRSVLNKGTFVIQYIWNGLNVAEWLVYACSFYLQVSINDSCWQWTNRYVASALAV